MATLTFSGIPSGSVQTSMDNVTYTEATSPITLVDGMYIWVSSSWQPIGQPITYVNSVYVNENQNDVWSNSRESPFILTHGGTLNYTTSSTQTATSAFIAKYVEQPKTTLDLSTLSDISDGTHTVKVKAKASGYIDSEFSNEVSYTKAPAGYSGRITCDDYYMDIYAYDSVNYDHQKLYSHVRTADVSGYNEYLVHVGNTVASFNEPSLTNCTYSYWQNTSGLYEGSNWRVTPTGQFTFGITSK